MKLCTNCNRVMDRIHYKCIDCFDLPKELLQLSIDQLVKLTQKNEDKALSLFPIDIHGFGDHVFWMALIFDKSIRQPFLTFGVPGDRSAKMTWALYSGDTSTIEEIMPVIYDGLMDRRVFKA